MNFSSLYETYGAMREPSHELKLDGTALETGEGARLWRAAEHGGPRQKGEPLSPFRDDTLRRLLAVYQSLYHGSQPGAGEGQQSAAQAFDGAALSRRTLPQSRMVLRRI